MNHHILIIHGIGKAQAGYSKPLEAGIRRAWDRIPDTKRADTQLAFHEVLWDDLVAFEQARLADVLRKGFGLAARDVALGIIDRILFFPKHLINSLRTDVAAEYIQDVLSYREPAAYKLIHGRVSAMLDKIASDTTPSCFSIIAHSLGTVIASDHIYDAQKQGRTLAGAAVFRNFFTLGSPIALFALQYGGVELFKSPARLEDPSGVWLNIFDKDDPVAYPLKSLNDAYNNVITADVMVETGWFGFSHTGYYKSPAAHHLIAQRL